jgi:flagellum-specific peptidoglycan hydrolase FlgJ
MGSDLAKNASNFYGITALRKSWAGRPVYRKGHPLWNETTGRFENKSTPFRFYENMGESVYDFAIFIGHPRYAKAWQCGDDVECWLENLQAAGYAQNPAWASSIIKMLNTYKASAQRISRPVLGRD